MLSKEVMRKYKSTPFFLYRLKDLADEISSNPNFIDAVLVLLGFIAFAAALPFYPLVILVVFGIALFFAGLKHAFLGLLLMLLLTFPMVMYQLPALAWIYLLAISFSMIYGYMHHRTIEFMYLLVALPFSAMGYLLSIPVFMLSILTIGFKRAAVMSVLVVLLIVMLSGLTGVQNSAYVPFDASVAHAALFSRPMANDSVPNGHGFGLLGFAGGVGEAYQGMTSGGIVNGISYEFGNLLSPLGTDIFAYFAFMALLVAAVFVTDMMAVTSRSEYRGAAASLACVLYPIGFAALAGSSGGLVDMVGAFASFALGLLALFMMEGYGVDIVKALDVRKSDLRLKFGDAFEDLASEGAKERFSDIGNYEATKRELSDAIIFPLEQKGISKAYNVKPIRGLLLFGPPGTGKTMLMRAIANEIHAGFFLIQGSNMISGIPGETQRKLANVFKIARKNMPCVLFIDEIDSIARSRRENSDEAQKEILTQLLQEMDGFNRLDKIIVVGATNVPQLIDPAVLRPGRFDRIIYMPLPDFEGRKKIFQHYLGNLPVSRGVNVGELARITERYSGADIKSLCESVAQEVAKEAAREHKVLEISQADIVNTIKRMKPSATLASIREYTEFKIDFERRVLGQSLVETSHRLSMGDVIGLDDAKKAVRDAVETPLLHPELVKRYGVSPIKGILLFGPPGNGKTMLMSAILDGIKDATVLQISGSELINEDSSSAINAVRKIFNRAAENTPAVVLVDEIDSITPSRETASEMAIQVTNEFLQQVDGIKGVEGIVIVGATNRPDALDPAILRPGRFDKLIYVRPPSAPERSEMFRYYLKDAPCDSNMDYKLLGDRSNGFTGADINNICREVKTAALRRAVESGNDVFIETQDVIGIIGRVKPSAPAALLDEYKEFLAKYGER